MYRPNNINPKKHYFLAIGFYKKFLERWTAEVFIHIPGNEIGLIGQYWPTSVHHVKMVPGKEIDLLFSVKHEISKNEYCLKDATFSNFVDCFKIGLKRQLLNLTSCSECQKHNVSICGIPYMKYFLDLENDLPFCSSTTSAQWSFTRLSDLLR
jgi:hypothetical protein